LNRIQNKHWYAIYVKSRHEKKVAENLDEIGVENYVPIKKELRQWSDRKKWVEKIVITCYVFVKISNKERETVLKQDSVVAFVRSSGKDAVIPDSQIEILQQVLGEKEFNAEVSYDDIEVGKSYEVISGTLIGKTVIVHEIKGKKKACICLEDINAKILFDIDINKLRIKN
jgi:transcription antitermination factor NusG